MKTRLLIAIGFVLAASVGIVIFALGRGEPLVSPATSTPVATRPSTESPDPTNTADPTVDWLEFSDPNGRFTVKYPPSWYLLEATSDELGYATSITSVDLTAYEGPPGETELLPNEFYIWIARNTTSPITDAELDEWVSSQAHPAGNVIDTTTVPIAGKTAIMEEVKLFSGQTAWGFHFATSEGVLSFIGEPIESSKVGQFEMILSTLKILK